MVVKLNSHTEANILRKRDLFGPLGDGAREGSRGRGTKMGVEKRNDDCLEKCVQDVE